MPGPRVRVSRCSALLPLLATLLLAACGGGTAAGVFHDPSFNKKAYSDRGIAVLGEIAASGLEGGGLVSEDYLTQELQSVLRDKRSDIDFIPSERATDTIGLPVALQLLESYRTRGRFGPSDLDELALLAPIAGYAIVGRMDVHAVTHTFESFQQRQEDDLQEGVEFVTYRELGSMFEVFDTQTGELVWTIYLTRKSRERRTETVGTRKLGDSFSEDQNWSYSQNPEKYPDPPEFTRMLQNLYIDFVIKLPN